MRCFALRSRCRGLRAIHEVLQFLAGLEEGDLLRRNFHFFSGLRITSYAAAALASSEAAEAADLDLVALLKSIDDAFKDGFDDGLGFFARKFGDAEHFLDQVSLGQRRLLCHRP